MATYGSESVYIGEVSDIVNLSEIIPKDSLKLCSEFRVHALY